jgi:hypothetical protein
MRVGEIYGLAWAGWLDMAGKSRWSFFLSFFLSASGSAFVFTTYAMSRSLPISIDWFFSFPIFERWICMTGFE